MNFRQSNTRSIIDIARAHGVRAFGASDVDPLQVYKKCSDTILSMRHKHGPCLLEFETHRWLEHCGPNNDDHLGYRDMQELVQTKTQDPIKTLESFLIDRSDLTEIDINHYENKIIDEVNQAFQYAQKSDFPKAADLYKFLYPSSDSY